MGYGRRNVGTRRPFAAWALAVALGVLPFASSPAHAEILAFAAASTAEALTDVIDAWRSQGGEPVAASFAASSTLARQIERDAPADLYLSANTDWADYLQQQDLLVAKSRRDLLGNRLVLIVPESDTRTFDLAGDFDLAALLGDDRLAVGDPDHVPAGQYARQALESLGLWNNVADKLARASDVRAALALVQRGEAPFGIVYGTDAAAAQGVRVAGAFPGTSHPQIVYPAALVAGADPSAQEFLSFLHGPKASAIFRRHGFTRP